MLWTKRRCKNRHHRTMRNDYVGDISDFVKFGVLRRLFLQQEIRLGVAWFLNKDNEATADGKKVKYLHTACGHRNLKDRDPDLHKKLARVVFGGRRDVAELQRAEILPGGTKFHNEPISVANLPKGAKSSQRARLAHREIWFSRAVFQLAESDVIFVDPDNGMEVGIKKHQDKSAKYVFFDELRRFYDHKQSLIIIQFGQRHRGSTHDQIVWRVGQLRTRLDHSHEIYSIYSGLGGSRTLYVVPSARHRDFLKQRLAHLGDSPWRHDIRIDEH